MTGIGFLAIMTFALLPVVPGARAADSVAVAADSVVVASDSVAVVPDSTAVASDSVVVTSDSAAVASDSVALAGDAPATVAEEAVPFLLVNDLQAPMITFDGAGGVQTITVKSSAGWWYLDGTIPWCEIKNVTDDGFSVRCRANSAPLARHSYIKVKTQGIDDATVAIVQASLPDNFLSVGVWRDSLKNRHLFECEDRSLMISEDERGFEDCPYAVFYVGDCVRGAKTGHGCCYDRYGNLLYSGEFYKNVPAGEFPSRDDYYDYKFECQKFSNGTLYLGETRRGLRHGYGIFISSDGTVWFGRWNNGQQIVSEGSVITADSVFSDFD